MTNFLLAPDSLKGSLCAVAACTAMREGILRAFVGRNEKAEIVAVPLADGGEGTVQALLLGAGGELQTKRVSGPLGEPTNAQWAILGDGSAVIEMAAASGLTLVSAEKRNALRASSTGTGELIKAALDAGCTKLLIGVGGSASTDGGVGALQALGARFLDGSGTEIKGGGVALLELDCIDLDGLDRRLRDATIQVLCDVRNPLCGLDGAAAVYSPQKGASPEEVELLEKSLCHLADVAAGVLGRDLRQTPGAGAAGGTAFGLMAFAGAALLPGIETILKATDFAVKLEQADLVLTAEGAIDAQTLQGKAVAGVARMAAAARAGRGVPVVAFAGAVSLTGAEIQSMGVCAALPLPRGPQTLDECVAQAPLLLAEATERAVRLWLHGP